MLIQDNMKHFLLLTLSCFSLFSCNFSRKTEQSVKVSLPDEVLLTKNMPDNEQILTRLRDDLQKETFRIEARKEGSIGWYDGEKKKYLVVKGDGIRRYYIQRKEAEPENYYPDFSMYVLEFSTEAQARACLEKINAALSTRDEFRHGKAPQTAVVNQNEVFCLSTRAEMFRGYINDFAGKIESYDKK